MSRKWGQDAHAGEAERDRSGRFRTSILCDCCGKPMGDLEKEGNHFTDGEVCGSGDGPGFFLCHRKRCQAAQEGKGIEERRTMFEAQRARNGAAAPVPVSGGATAPAAGSPVACHAEALDRGYE